MVLSLLLEHRSHASAEVHPEFPRRPEGCPEDHGGEEGPRCENLQFPFASDAPGRPVGANNHQVSSGPGIAFHSVSLRVHLGFHHHKALHPRTAAPPVWTVPNCGHVSARETDRASFAISCGRHGPGPRKMF